MTFNSLELASILKLAVLMAQADGKVTEEERGMIAFEFNQRLGVTSKTESDRISNLAAELEPSAELSYISRMNAEKKEYVTAFLGMLMAIDGEIDGKELVLVNLVTDLCDLPGMSLARASEILSKGI